MAEEQRRRDERREAGEEARRSSKAAAGEGRQGDWECSRCGNRNYNFRSLCNRCKQPRLFVDASTAADSKWLPRVGDWICAGCSNNNYAFREKCNKCERPREEAAMPAITMHRASFSSQGNYFAREHEPYGSRLQTSAIRPLNGKGGFSSDRTQLLSLPKGWRGGDWICDCGFHNYSSRSECKNCNAPLTSAGPSGASSSVADIFPTLGTKRLASEEFPFEWYNKRLNTGNIGSRFLQNPYRSYDQPSGSSYHQLSLMYANYASGNLVTPTTQVNARYSEQRTGPVLPGKGATHLRDGDWMCNNCKNHNYAFRSFCNRCNTEKGAANLPVSNG